MEMVTTFEEYARNMLGIQADKLSSTDMEVIMLEKEYISAVAGNGHRSPMRTERKIVEGFYLPDLDETYNRALSRRQKDEYFDARDNLLEAMLDCSIEKRHLDGAKFDYSMGTGGSALFLDRLDGFVEASEADHRLYGAFCDTMIENDVNAICGDAFGHMLDNPGRYELITAFNLGRYGKKYNKADSLALIRGFRDAAEYSIKDSGRIFVAADLLTMDKVREVFGMPLMYGDNPCYMAYQK